MHFPIRSKSKRLRDKSSASGAKAAWLEGQSVSNQILPMYQGQSFQERKVALAHIPTRIIANDPSKGIEEAWKQFQPQNN